MGAGRISAVRRALDDPGQAPDPYFDNEMTLDCGRADWLPNIQGRGIDADWKIIRREPPFVPFSFSSQVSHMLARGCQEELST